jgi:hypothetical protein
MIFAFISLISSLVSEKIDPAFTKTYFVQKNVAQIAVFACWNESGKLSLKITY